MEGVGRAVFEGTGRAAYAGNPCIQHTFTLLYHAARFNIMQLSGNIMQTVLPACTVW